MRVIVTGATGFVGQSLIKSLIFDGIQVVGVGRRHLSGQSFEYHVIQDYVAYGDWQSKLAGCDAVIHLAARVHMMKESSADPLAEFRRVNVDGTLNLANQAAAAGVNRFVYLSSIKVNGEHTAPGKPFTEDDIASPEDAYGYSKIEAEQGLWLIAQKTGMEVVIIRPPLVYGRGMKANFARMVHAVRLGIPLPLGAIHNKRSFVSIDNLISLIVLCINHPNAANQVFLVSDGYDLSTTTLLQMCANALNVQGRLLPVPQKWIEFFSRVLGKSHVYQRLCGNLQLDISKASQLLGWVPPVTVIDGLRRAVDSKD